MEHFKITFEPDDISVSIHKGAKLVDAAGLAGIILNTACGGRGTCKKCIVHIGPDFREVLACKYQIESNLKVRIPDQSRYFQEKILDYGLDIQIEPSANLYQKYRLQAHSDRIFGLAIDIGTTTVVAILIDMADGKIVATDSILNPQTCYGDDVISRISYAQTEKGLQILQKAVIDAINKLVKGLCQKASISTADIYEVCAVGNTTMTHILLNFPIAQLGRLPYKAHSLDAKDLPPTKLGIEINPTGNVHVGENIAGFVGSDTVSVSLASEIASADSMTLIVDIGTNGEIVLGTKQKLYAASCAAGPALEGARISCGGRAADGAIEAVIINNDDIDVDIIGNKPANLICGSGLIDAVAVMLDIGIIDSTGRFVEPEKLQAKLPEKIFSRLQKRDDEPAFYLTEKIYLTQKDIRQVQLAKAAIKTGIILMQKRMDVADDDIEQILLAGAFGNYIKKQSALRVGLLPSILPERIKFIGNAAASGARMILVSAKARQAAKEIAEKIEYIEIAHEPDFQDIFADSMSF